MATSNNPDGEREVHSRSGRVTIENPVGGERLTSLATGRETVGARLAWSRARKVRATNTYDLEEEA